ncbi:MAG: hypothetical protein HY423_09750, partial [Candidatus Lambdaproteobacteria bacterium]|nr:hypothetical protein [Candidatus Lambdaproteobacteria bacterium]
MPMAPAHPDLASRLTLALEREDRLGVLSSTLPVVRGARHVGLDGEAIVRFARAQARVAAPVNAEDALHCTFLPPRRFLNYLLVLEALNFSFWDDEPRWRVPYHGAAYDGYWALAAALHRAIREDGLPLWDARYLADLTEPRLARLLRGEGKPPPLIAERLAHLREIGAVLVRDFGGAFAELLAPCAGDAATFVLRVVESFPSFRDEALWQGQPVRFYKRAQICASDLARLLHDAPEARLAGLEQLTAFADYKVPQVLRREG